MGPDCAQAGRRGDGSLHIATDSLGSIHAIAKLVARPQDVREHIHLSILQSIVQAIQDAPGPVHLWKVESHIGVVGNERADKAAVAVAKGEAEGGTYSKPSNDRTAVYWPHVEEQSTVADGQLTRKFVPLATLGDALRNVAHACRRLGSAPTTGVYASSWQRVTDQIDHQTSHAFITSSRVSYQARKLALQYRWGLLPTMRWMQKIGKSITMACPLCGVEDGGHHAVSACPAVSTAVTRRHNDAGTEIMEAILRGKCGECIMMTDVGLQKRRPDTELPAGVQQQRFMTCATLPPYVPAALQVQLRGYRDSVPDALLVEELKAEGRLVHYNGDQILQGH